MHGGQELEAVSNEKMGVKEQNLDRKAQDTLDGIIKKSIGREQFSPFTREGESSVQLLQLFDSLNQSASKASKVTKLEAGVEKSWQDDNHKLGNIGISVNDAESLAQCTLKSIGESGRTLQASADRTQSLNLSEAVVAFAQAAAKANDTPGWSLMTPKLQVQKCDKCRLEFYSTLNYRRHIRMHRRSLKVGKEDLRKEREHLGAFWDKLSLDDASHIVAVQNLLLEDLSGSSVARSLSAFIQQPGFSSLSQSYLKAGVVLLDIAQSKMSKFPLASEELFSILDDSSERTFLCGIQSASMQRFIFEGEAAKVGSETKNLVASLAFLVEQKLVNAWMADKDVEALRCQKALVEEEEAAQKKREMLEERKRLKKMRQRGLKGKEQRGSEMLTCHIQLNSGCEIGEGCSGNQGEENSPTATQSSPSSSGSRQDFTSSNPSSMDNNEFEGSCTVSSILRLDDKDRFAGINEEIRDDLTTGPSVDCIKKDIVFQDSGSCTIQGEGHHGIAAHHHEMDISQGKAEEKTERHDNQSYHSGSSPTELSTHYAGRLASDKMIGRGWRERKRYDSMQFANNPRVFSGIDRSSSMDTNFNRSFRETKRLFNLDLSSVQDDTGILPHSKPFRSPRSGHYRDKIPGVKRFSPGSSCVHAVWTKKVQKNPVSELDQVVCKETLDVQHFNNFSLYLESSIVVDHARGDKASSTYTDDGPFIEKTNLTGSSEQSGNISMKLSSAERPSISAPDYAAGQSSHMRDIGSTLVIGSLSVPLGNILNSDPIWDLEAKAKHYPLPVGNVCGESGRDGNEIKQRTVDSFNLPNLSRGDSAGILLKQLNTSEISSQVTSGHGTDKEKQTECCRTMNKLGEEAVGNPVAGAIEQHEREADDSTLGIGSLHGLEGGASDPCVGDMSHPGSKASADPNKQAIDRDDHDQSSSVCSISSSREQSLKLGVDESADSSTKVQEVEGRDPMFLVLQPEAISNFLSKRWADAVTAAVSADVPLSDADDDA